MQLKLISCEVLYREMCAAVARSPHAVDIEFLPKGLHDKPCREMLHALQEMVDRTDASKYQGILLGYGLCGNGVAGLTARTVPVILPRAHDCITLFLGGKDRYLDYFDKHPGVYFKTTGWIERGQSGDGELGQLTLNRMGMGMSYAEMVAKYGEDNAQFLVEQQSHYKIKYSQFTFIEMGVEPDDRFERCTLEEAIRRGWKYEKISGDMSLIEALVNGDWDEERFLCVPPHHRVVARYDDGIVGIEEAA